MHGNCNSGRLARLRWANYCACLGPCILLSTMIILATGAWLNPPGFASFCRCHLAFAFGGIRSDPLFISSSFPFDSHVFLVLVSGMRILGLTWIGRMLDTLSGGIPASLCCSPTFLTVSFSPRLEHTRHCLDAVGSGLFSRSPLSPLLYSPRSVSTQDTTCVGTPYMTGKTT